MLESARMFATLDPKLRQLQLPSRRKILLSDTVGFIRNLPHTLVTSFRATLEEVERAEVLLHVQDASSPMLDEQKAQVEKVLAELEVSGKPILQVLNKTDLVPPGELAHLEARKGAILVSGLKKSGLEALLAAIERGAGGGPADRFRVSPTAVGRRRTGVAGGWGDRRIEAFRGQPGVPAGARPGLAAEPLSQVPGADGLTPGAGRDPSWGSGFRADASTRALIGHPALLYRRAVV